MWKYKRIPCENRQAWAGRITGLSLYDGSRCTTVKSDNVTVSHLLLASRTIKPIRRIRFLMGLATVWAGIIIFWLNLTGWQFYGHTKIFWTRLISVLLAG